MGDTRISDQKIIAARVAKLYEALKVLGGGYRPSSWQRWRGLAGGTGMAPKR